MINNQQDYAAMLAYSDQQKEIDRMSRGVDGTTVSAYIIVIFIGSLIAHHVYYNIASWFAATF